MSDRNTYKKLPFSPYELAELDYSRNQGYENYYKKPIDYGTGELITPLEAHFITRIYFRPGITVKDMAVLSRRTKSAVSQMASKLAAKEMLRFEPHPTDSRQIKLYVTEKGEQLSRAHIEYDDNEYGILLKEMIEKFGFEAVKNYMEILQFMSEQR